MTASMSWASASGPASDSQWRLADRNCSVARSFAVSIWARCAQALGHPEWCEDPRFANNQERVQNRVALEAEMEAALTTATTDHWVEVLEAAGVPCGPVYNYQQMFADHRCASAA